jgi:hypothetical protein
MDVTAVLGRALASRAVNPKILNIGSHCSFAWDSAFRSENNEPFGYDLKNGGPMSRKEIPH